MLIGKMMESKKEKGKYKERCGDEAIIWVKIIPGHNFSKYVKGRTNFNNTIGKKVNSPSET